MDPDPEFDAAFGWQAGVSLYHAVLHLDGATHGLNYTAELHEDSVAGALYHPPVMHSDGGIDQIATESPQPRQRPILVGASKPAISDHIRSQNGSEFPGLGHAFRHNPVAQRRVSARRNMEKDITPQNRIL
jgi:hypothetical protein